jgi:hypothetical protein
MDTRLDSPTCADAIESAIRAMSNADWYRLRQAARILAWKVPSLDGETLLFDALERTLSGRRRWNHGAVNFVGHLIGVMRSVAYHEGKRRGRTVGLTSSMDLIAPDDPENALAAEEKIRRLRGHFGERGDDRALLVLDAMELGCDGPMIRAQIGLNQTELETVVRRIRRVALRILPS